MERLDRLASSAVVAPAESLAHDPRRVFVEADAAPFLMPRVIAQSQRDPRLLDRLEHLVQRLGRHRRFLGCQMHLLQQPA